MKLISMKNHPLAFFLVLVLSLAAIAGTANYFDGNLTPRTDDAYSLGEAGSEWKDIHIDGHAYLDSATITNITTPWSTLSLTTGVSSALTPTVDNNYDLGGQSYRWRNFSVAGIAGGLTPTTDDSRDLGSSSLEWRNLYVDGTANLDAAIIGTATVTTDNVTTLSVATGVASPLTPTIDDDYDLGSSSKQWKDLYIDGTANIDAIDVGTSNIVRPMVFSLTQTSAARVLARWQPSRALRVVRIDAFSEAIPVGGTANLSMTNGAVTAGVSHTGTQTTSGALTTDFASGLWINLSSDGGNSSGGSGTTVVVQVQDN